MSENDVRPLYDALAAEGAMEGQVVIGGGAGSTGPPQVAGEVAAHFQGGMNSSGSKTAPGSKTASGKRASDSGHLDGACGGGIQGIRREAEPGSGVFGLGLKQRILARLSSGADRPPVAGVDSAEGAGPAPRLDPRFIGGSPGPVPSTSVSSTDRRVLDLASTPPPPGASSWASSSSFPVSTTLRGLGLLRGPSRAKAISMDGMARDVSARAPLSPSEPKISPPPLKPPRLPTCCATHTMEAVVSTKAEHPEVATEQAASSSEQAAVMSPDSLVPEGGDDMVASSPTRWMCPSEEPTSSVLECAARTPDGPSQRSFPEAFLPLPPAVAAMSAKDNGHDEPSRGPAMSRVMGLIDKAKIFRDEFLGAKSVP